MRKLPLILCFLLIFIAFRPSAYGVYLEYSDEEGSKKRTITIDFSVRGYSKEDIEYDRRTQEEISEESRRARRVLEKKALVFTEKQTITTKKGNNFQYRVEEKDFFHAPKALTFLQWIETADSIKRLNFFNIQTEEDALAVKNALGYVVSQQHLNVCVDEFFLLDCPSQKKKAPTSIMNRGNDFELENMTPKTQEPSKTLFEKFQHTEVTFSGKNKDKGMKQAEEALRQWPTIITSTLTLKVL